MATIIARPVTSPVHTLDFVRVTENAALAASRWMGRGEREFEVDIAVDPVEGTNLVAARTHPVLMQSDGSR